jgi:hypothetical protein
MQKGVFTIRAVINVIRGLSWTQKGAFFFTDGLSRYE